MLSFDTTKHKVKLERKKENVQEKEQRASILGVICPDIYSNREWTKSYVVVIDED